MPCEINVAKLNVENCSLWIWNNQICGGLAKTSPKQLNVLLCVMPDLIYYLDWGVW